MQPLVSAMASLRDLLIAAFRSLTRGRSFIEALLAFWISPQVLKECQDPSDDPQPTLRPVHDFLREVDHLLSRPVEPAQLCDFSRSLKAQFRQRLWSDRACMLPSYNYQLPNGSEQGRYLALDVGGSTLRVALVDLKGLKEGGFEGSARILRIENFRIDVAVKGLVGRAFFDWMAARVRETIILASKGVEECMININSLQSPMLMGLAWSFPIEQTSLKGGLLQNMGKGFLAADGLLGQDLGDIIKQACKDHGLQVEVAAIINDSSAALLSESYRRPSTRFGLILGTGFNIAAHLPVITIDRPKFGTRPASWFDKASHVIVNTEMGMFGNGFLPMTRWDEQLKASHPKPDFQPLEHFVAGLYIGELARLIMIEAINTTGLFGGVVPPSLVKPYTLETETLSILESDNTPLLESAQSTFSARHPTSQKPLVSEMLALRTISRLVTRRSAALVAAALYGLWELKREVESELVDSQNAETSPSSVQFLENAKAELDLGSVAVGFNGSVIEQYPDYRENCQQYINGLFQSFQEQSAETAAFPGASEPFELVPAKESSLLGAAVALACLERGKAN